jgi:hypothetical protein
VEKKREEVMERQAGRQTDRARSRLDQREEGREERALGIAIETFTGQPPAGRQELEAVVVFVRQRERDENEQKTEEPEEGLDRGMIAIDYGRIPLLRPRCRNRRRFLSCPP